MVRGSWSRGCYPPKFFFDFFLIFLKFFFDFFLIFFFDFFFDLFFFDLWGIFYLFFL